MIFAPFGIRFAIDVSSGIIRIQRERFVEKFHRIFKTSGALKLNAPPVETVRVAAGGIIQIELLRLLFPGFFTENPIHSYEIKMETANLMDSVQGRLQDEIYKSLLYSKSDPGQARAGGGGGVDCRLALRRRIGGLLRFSQLHRRAGELRPIPIIA